MTLAPVLIVDPDAARGEAHARALRRLGFTAAVVADWRPAPSGEPCAILLDVGLATSLGDLRRVAPGIPVIVACDAEHLDEAVVALDDTAVSFVAPPCDDADYALAVSSLRLPGVVALSEGDAGYALRLAALGEEIARIARAIDPPPASSGAPAVPEAPLSFDPAWIRGVLKARRLRDSLFAPGTFADPVWDMLLDLTASRVESRLVSITSLAIAAAVPGSTALRHLKAMADAGLIVRRADPADGRRVFIELSADAFARMRAWVAGAGKAV